MTLLPFALLLIAVALVAYFDAKREARMIDARPGGPDLDHKELIWRRLRNIGALVMVAVVCDGTEGWDALWMGLCHAGGAWAMFVLVHRLSLNLRREMDWRYVSPGNDYDWRFLKLTLQGSRDRDIAKDDHAFNYEHSPSYGREVHRAGTLAYIFETLILAASIVGAIVILTNT